MDIHQQLSTLLSSCSWVKEPSEALRRVPALGAEMPAFIRVLGQRDLRIPVSDVGPLCGTVVRTLVDASSRVLSGGMGDRVDQLSPDAVANDPLVQFLERQLCQLGAPGVRRDAVPLLATAWVCSRVLGGRVGELTLQDAALIRQSEKLSDRLQSMDVTGRGEVLAGLSWEISGRVGAALNMASQSRKSLKLSGLARSLLPSRLIMGFPRGTLDQELDLHLVSGVLGLGLDEELLARLERVAVLAIEAASRRLAAGQPSGVDLALSQALQARLDPQDAASVLVHSVAGPLLVGSLPALVSSKDLRAGGLEKSLVSAFSDPTAMCALAAAWSDMVAALAEWDVLSVLVDRVIPIRRVEGGWACKDKRLEPGAMWPCLQPRQDPDAPLCAVAVRFTDIRKQVDGRAKATGRATSAGVVESAWARFCESRSCGVHDWVGDHGIAVFEKPLDALEFARAASSSFSGPFDLPIGARGGTISVHAGLRVGVGVAEGVLLGGGDGNTFSLAGPVVGTAMALSGSGLLDGSAEEAGGYRRAVNGETGLRSEGIVVDAAFLQRLCAEYEDAGKEIHGPEKSGEGNRGFEFFAVRCWWQEESDTAIAIGIGEKNSSSGAAEIVEMNEMEFANFCNADRVGGRMKRGAQIRSEARWEGFGDEESEAKGPDDIDAVFLGKTVEPSAESPAGPFAPSAISSLAEGGGQDVPELPGEIVAAPMILEPVTETTAPTPERGELPGPAVFIDDDWDVDGWEETSWEDEGWGDTQVEPQTSVAAPSPGDLGRIIKTLTDHFVVARSGGSFYFGRPGGTSFNDAFMCDAAGDTLEAYKSLLIHQGRHLDDGIRSAVMGIQEDWIPEPLDTNLLKLAVQELKW